jgi:Outer membrane protein beta-barrel family/Carboxypeptidase regulatory-like domain
MKKPFSLACFIVSSYFLNAQVTVQGKITDEKNTPQPYVSVALIAARDSHLIKGALTDDMGNFTLPSVSEGHYRILASSVGFEKNYSEVFTVKTDSKMAMVDFTLKPVSKMLGEAVVTASRPLFEQKADRLVVNVANSPIAAGGTALEILTKVPGVVIINDKVTLGGNKSVQVWIDGKPSPYNDVNEALRNMPGDQIDRIELITQPGARYDASGGPILNIILKRNAELGLTGTANMTLGGFKVNQSDVNAGTRNYYRLNPSLSMNYRSGILNLFGNMAYNQGNYFSIIKTNRYIKNEVFKGFNFDETDYTYRNLRLGADIYATKKTTLGIILRGWSRTGDGNATSTTDVFKQDLTTKTNSFITDNLTNSHRSGYSSNFNIKHDIDVKTGHSLNFDLDYNHFNTDNINNLSIYKREVSNLASNSQQSVKQPVDIWVGKGDYILPIDSTFKLETGAKTSFATINNDLKFYRAKELSAKESNDFLYKENINAGYVNLSKTIGKIDLNGGIRAEQTIVTGTSMNSKVLDRNYLQWFPSASALYHVDKHIGIQAGYSRRVNRPEFQQQNPFTYFIDSLTYTRGNPNLLPEIANAGKLSVVYDGQPFVSIERTVTDDVIIENAPQVEGTKTFTTAANLAQFSNWTFQLNFPIKLGKWLDGFGGNQAIYNAYNADYRGFTYKASKWHWLAYWGITAKLPADIKVEINGFYMTKFLNEFLTIGSLGGLNIGASKTFWDKRGRLSLNINDILYSQNTNAVIDVQGIKVDFFQRQYSRNARLTFSYTFGNTKVKSVRNRGTGSESETSRVKVE